ncbi:MAG: endolytic transglycosylase MltG [Clostridia bacterium]|nr:endolytic transglycosylase MltG [Clostridia bacterium]
MDENFNNQKPQDVNQSNTPFSDDDFIIGKGFQLDQSEYNSSKEAEKKKQKKKRGASVVKNIIWILSIIVVSVGLAFGIIYAGADFMGIGFGRGDDCSMQIEPGTPASEIANQLKETGAVKIPMLFRVYTKFKGYDSQFKYGLYNFNTESGYESISQMLMTEGAKAESITVTIPEGTGITDYTKNVNGENVTVPGIGTLLEKAGVCTKEEFMSALHYVELNSRLLKSVNVGKTYYELEGYLFPETYDFYSYDSDECAALAIARMIKESEKRITDKMFARAEEMGYTMNEILTMASIIQMEAGQSSSEMANVAAVFYNRLNSEAFSTLGSSPTCYYGSSYKNDDGRYNTYNIKGLPPGPLCSPGIDAIKAALYPTEDVPYYYFVTDSEGNFYYHKTLSEQQVTINRLQRENKWVYEYFN